MSQFVKYGAVIQWMIVVSLAFYSPAYAERADREKPMAIDADKVIVDDAKQTSVFEGRVLFTQGTLQVRAAKVEMKNFRDGGQTVIAQGNPVSFKQKLDQSQEFVEAYAERVEYDARSEQVKLSGRAILRKGGDEVRGNMVIYDAKNETYQVLGGTANASKNNTGRVHIVIQPRVGAAGKKSNLPIISLPTANTPPQSSTPVIETPTP